MTTFRDAAGQAQPVWRMIWPVFGATNQLLGALALLVISTWLRRRGRSVWITLGPMLFMATATLLALVQLSLDAQMAPVIRSIAAVLFLLAVVLLFEALRSLASGQQRRA